MSRGDGKPPDAIATMTGGGAQPAPWAVLLGPPDRNTFPTDLASGHL